MTSVTKTLMHRFMNRVGPCKHKTWLAGQPLVQVSWVIKGMGMSFPTLRFSFIIYKVRNLSFPGLIFCATVVSCFNLHQI